MLADQKAAPTTHVLEEAECRQASSAATVSLVMMHQTQPSCRVTQMTAAATQRSSTTGAGQQQRWRQLLRGRCKAGMLRWRHADASASKKTAHIWDRHRAAARMLCAPGARLQSIGAATIIQTMYRLAQHGHTVTPAVTAVGWGQGHPSSQCRLGAGPGRGTAGD